MAIRTAGSSRAGMCDEQRRMTTTFTALSGLAGNLKSLSRRENLLWVSADFPLLLGEADLGGRGVADSKGGTRNPISIFNVWRSHRTTRPLTT